MLPTHNTPAEAIRAQSIEILNRHLAAADERTHAFAIVQATDFGDVNTAGLLAEISRGVDRQLWLEETHVAP